MFAQELYHVDINEVRRQLTALGYKKGDTVYLRGFYHRKIKDTSTNPSISDDKGRKAECSTSEDVARVAQQWINEGRGVYIVVNGGGAVDSQVKEGKAIFFEHDDLPKEVQLNLWQTLNLPAPTFQVDTGGKSIHSYWVFNTSISVNDWRQLQSDLLVMSSADRNIKNPSRVMRLAGAFHISPDGTFPTQIINATGTLYSFDMLRGLIPHQKQESAPLLQAIPTGEVPLEVCLSKSDRELINGGVSEGGRNSTGAKLARNLIGTALRLQYLGIRYDGDPRILFDTYCARCTPSLDAREADQIYKSAYKDNPSPTLTDDAIENCVKAWLRQQQASAGKVTGNSGLRLIKGGASSGDGNQPPTNEIGIKERVRQIVEEGLADVDRRVAYNEIAQEYGINVKEVEKLAAAILIEVEKEESSSEQKLEIEQLLGLGAGTINLFDYLPSHIAAALEDYRTDLNIRPEVALLSLLAATSTLHKVGTKLVIHRTKNFVVPPTIFGAVIAESGAKKSPITKQIITDPLNQLHEEAKQRYKRALEAYERDMAEWNPKSNEPKPEKPEQELFYVTESSGEGIKAQASRCPEKTIFINCDELKGFFNSQNQYRGGKGSDKQDCLSFFDGSGARTLRVGGITNDVSKVYLSIFGTTQPSVIKDAMGDDSDPDGTWARFLFVQQPLIASELPDDDGGGISITDLLTSTYRRLHKVPEQHYTLSREAFKLYQPYYKKLDQIRVSHPKSGMRAVYAKAEGYTGRLALNLHVLNELAEGYHTPCTEIPVETMRKAIKLMNFFIGQTKLLYSGFDEGTAPHILKLIEFSKNKFTNTGEGWVKAKDVQLSINKKSRPTPDMVRSWMREAESLGFGTTRGIGRNTEFLAHVDNVVQNNPSSSKVDKVDESRPKVDPPSTFSNNHISMVSEDKNSKVDKVDPTPHPKNGTENKAPEVVQNNLENIDSKNNPSTLSTGSTLGSNVDTASNTEVDPPSTLGLLSSTLGSNSENDSFEPISLLQIEESDGDVNGFVGCEVKVLNISGAVKFIGTLTSYDKLNGSVKVTLTSGEVKTCSVREVFAL